MQVRILDTGVSFVNNRITINGERRRGVSTKRITAYYSLNQVGFWMVFCLSSSFAAVYLGALGYSNTKLGSMLALGSVLGFLLGTGLSSFVDTSPRFNAADVLWPVLALQAAFFLLLLFFPARGVVTTLCYPLLLAFTLAVNTLNLKLCADFEHYESPVNYGIARSMGSAAYMVLSMLLGVWVTRFGVRVIPIAGLAVTALQGVSNALLSRSVLRLRRKLLSGHAAPAPQGRSLGVFLRESPRFCLLLAGMALLFFSHNTTSTFLINFVEHAGGGIETLGYLTAFLTALEVPTMLFFSRIFRRRSCAAVLRFSFIFFALKTAAIAAAPNIPLLFAAESLQVLSYALYAPAIVAYVTLIVPYDDAAKGQSLAFSMTTIGGVLASLRASARCSFRSGNGMDRSGGLRRRCGHRLPRAGKAEEYLCCLATVNKDTKRFFQTAARGGLDDLVDELSPFGYRPSTTEELTDAVMNSTYLYEFSPWFFEWAASCLQKKQRTEKPTKTPDEKRRMKLLF